MENSLILGASCAFDLDTEREALLRYITSEEPESVLMLRLSPSAPNTIEVTPVFMDSDEKALNVSTD